MADLLPLENARARLIALAAKTDTETVSTGAAVGRYLAEDVMAKRSQPAGDMSAMDGYAIAGTDPDGPWQQIGECAAGRSPCRALKPGECARIFTGALLPEGADTVVIQENVTADGDRVRLKPGETADPGQHVRRQGGDFAEGDLCRSAGSEINAAAIGHLLAAGHAEVPVHRPATVAIISTGDELVRPGDVLEPHQIPGSNGAMLSALLKTHPATTRDLGLIPDTMDAVVQAIEAARTSDIIVTIGGASVGDHDLVLPALRQCGAEMDFWKVAIKPGKPLMAGKLGNGVVLGLPGNPASAFVTAQLFLLPLIRFMTGASAWQPQLQQTRTTEDLPAVRERTEFLRAKMIDKGLLPFPSQDSAKLSVLADSDALIMRPAHGGPIEAGADVPYLPI